jgi:hypothetical protein
MSGFLPFALACVLLTACFMRSDPSLRAWATVDDVWKTMSTAPRQSDFVAAEPSAVNMALVNRARRSAESIGVRESRAQSSVLTKATVLPESGYDASADRKLWRVAGGLIALAIAVLAVLGWVTLSPGSAMVASSLAAPLDAPAAPSPEPRVEPLASAPSARASTPRPAKSKHAKHTSHKRARRR